MLYWIIYLIDVITPLKNVFTLLTVTGFAATAVSLTVIVDSSMKDGVTKSFAV